MSESLGSYVRAALSDAEVPREDRDARGLMPLARARKILAGTRRFASGRPVRVGDSEILPSDLTWAALVSLADAREFVRHAKRLEWDFPPRGATNSAFAQRYGEGILPWLEAQVDKRGRLNNDPWCIEPCLMALGSPAALEVVLRISNRAFVQDWLAQHPDAGVEAIARGVAHPALDLFAKRAAPAVRKKLASAVGAARSRELGGGGGATISEREILSVLDGCAAEKTKTEGFPWPLFRFGLDDRCEYSGLRLVAARERRGRGWGVVLERITGSSEDGMAIERYLYGSHCPPGQSESAQGGLSLRIKGPRDEEGFPILACCTLSGPAGALKLSERWIASADLRPRRLAEPGNAVQPSLIALRAYLTRWPGAFWEPAARGVKHLNLEAPQVLVDCDAFHHVVGAGGGDDADRKRHLCVPPSTAESYRSLARALAARDADAFVPGLSNLGWRLHLR